MLEDVEVKIDPEFLKKVEDMLEDVEEKIDPEFLKKVEDTVKTKKSLT